MKVLYMFRREGKTTKAAEFCKKTGAYMLVLNKAWAEITSDAHGLPMRQIVTYAQLLSGKLRGIHGDLVIDDADRFLQFVAGGFNLRLITLSKPFTKAYCKKHGFPLDFVGKT